MKYSNRRKKTLHYRGYQIVWLGPNTWGDEWYADKPGTMFNAIYRKSLKEIKKAIIKKEKEGFWNL